MEQIVVKKEPEEMVCNSKDDISMDYDKPSTAYQDMPSTSEIAIKQEIKEELDDYEALLDKGSKINDSEEENDNSDHDKSNVLSCDIKKEGRNCEENDKDNEKDENEDTFETKIKVEYHCVEYNKSVTDSNVNKEILAKVVLPKEENEIHEEQSRSQVDKEKLFKCGICFKKYLTEEGLYYHKRYVHKKGKQEEFKCGKCEYQTLKKGDFKNHLKIHDEKSYFKCNFCHYMASRLRTLHAHILSKHKLENKEENQIKITSKIHECTSCSYSTVFKTNYDNHINVCLKLKNVIWHHCHICHYKTNKKSNLNSHIKTHNQIIKLKCLFCQYHFFKKQSFDNHILTMHSDLLNESNRNIITSKVHCCQHCKYKTALASSLKKHLNKKH